MLVEALGQEHTLGHSQCCDWYTRFRRNDFDVKNRSRGRPTGNFEDAEWQALLDDDDTLTQVRLARRLNVSQKTICKRLRRLGKVRKVGSWEPHNLANAQEMVRKTIFEIHFARLKKRPFWRRIMTSDEKWIYFENSKRSYSYLNPGQPSTRYLSAKKGVIYYELLNPGEPGGDTRSSS